MSGEAPKYLAEVLAPCHSVDFFSTTFGRKFAYIPGAAGKFSGLLPWDALNQILRQHRLDSPRLRMFLNGKQVPASSYLRHTQSTRRGRSTIPRVRAREFTEKLREGATLILDAADELYEPLTTLAENLERTFCEYIQVNAYAGWHTSPGFDLHWDDHDVLILQLQGRKQWVVHGPTRRFPLARDAERNTVRPETPVWENILSDGDLLYIPRGWWHGAVPLAEPTLHLTIGIHNRTGIDLLSWLQDEMRKSELFRSDLPRFATAAQRSEHMAQLRAELMARWNAGLLGEYFVQRDAAVRPRAAVGLPWTALSDTLPPDDEFELRFTIPRPLKFTDEPDGITFSFDAAARTWQFAAEARPVIDLLADGRVFSFSELCNELVARLDRETLRGFLSELVKEGLVALI